MVEHVSDFKMPEKIVTRLLKDALPEDVVISKEAKNVACRSASVFILNLSTQAAEKAAANRRRTLDTRDIIEAAADLGLGEYTPQLVRFGAQRKRNAKRKETNIQKSKSKRAANSSDQQAPGATDIDGTDGDVIMSDNQDEDSMRADIGQPLEECEHFDNSASNKNEDDEHEEADIKSETHD